MIEMASSTTMAVNLSFATLILVAGVIDDLRTRKFHNWLFLTCSAIAIVVSLITGGVGSLPFALMGFGAGIVVLLPFVLLNMVGAGDMKLLAAFGILAGASTVIWVIIASFVWGSIFGLVKVIASGQGRVLMLNMYSIVSFKKREQIEVHRMPFAFAILMGWLSFLVDSRLL